MNHQVTFPSKLDFGRPYSVQVGDCKDPRIAARVALEHAAQKGITLHSVRITDIDTRGGNFSGLKAINCDFSGVLWEQSRLDGAEFTGCQFDGAVFSDTSSAADAVLIQCDLSRATLARFNAPRTQWAGCNFANAQAPGLVAPDSTFSNCRTHAANFAGAVLTWADMRSCANAGEIIAGSAGTAADRAVLEFYNRNACNRGMAEGHADYLALNPTIN